MPAAVNKPPAKQTANSSVKPAQQSARSKMEFERFENIVLGLRDLHVYAFDIYNERILGRDVGLPWSMHRNKPAPEHLQKASRARFKEIVKQIEAWIFIIQNEWIKTHPDEKLPETVFKELKI